MSGRVGTPQQVADYLECDYQTVLDLKKQAPGFPWVQISPQRWVVPWVALDDWLDQRTQRNATNGDGK